MRPPRWLLLGGATAVIAAAWLASPRPAVGQGVPTWAVHVAERPDAGPSATAQGSSGGVVHGRTAYRRDGGVAAPLDKDRFLVEPLEFFLGFNPLERSPEELARRQDGGPKPDKPTQQPPPEGGPDGGQSGGPGGGPGRGAAGPAGGAGVGPSVGPADAG